MFNIKTVITLNFIILLGCGCMSPYVTNTKRSGVEQLLLSTATDRSVKQINNESITGKKIFLDLTQLESIDRGYVIGAVSAEFFKSGVFIVGDKKDADIVIAVYSGALGTDGDELLIGVPEMAVPVPFSGAVQTPEIVLFKIIKQTGVSKLGFYGYKADSKDLVFSAAPLFGRSYYHRWQILFLGFSTTDIPENNEKNETTSEKSL